MARKKPDDPTKDAIEVQCRRLRDLALEMTAYGEGRKGGKLFVSWAATVVACADELELAVAEDDHDLRDRLLEWAVDTGKLVAKVVVTAGLTVGVTGALQGDAPADAGKMLECANRVMEQAETIAELRDASTLPEVGADPSTATEEALQTYGQGFEGNRVQYGERDENGRLIEPMLDADGQPFVLDVSQLSGGAEVLADHLAEPIVGHASDAITGGPSLQEADRIYPRTYERDEEDNGQPISGEVVVLGLTSQPAIRGDVPPNVQIVNLGYVGSDLGTVGPGAERAMKIFQFRQGVGAQLAAMRQRHGWTITQVAEGTNLPESVVANIESGHTNQERLTTYLRRFESFIRSGTVSPDADVKAIASQLADVEAHDPNG